MQKRENLEAEIPEDDNIAIKENVWSSIAAENSLVRQPHYKLSLSEEPANIEICKSDSDNIQQQLPKNQEVIDKLNVPISQVFDAKSIEQLKGGKDLKAGNITVKFDKKYNLIRLTDSASNVTNLYLNKDGSACTKVVAAATYTKDLIDQLVAAVDSKLLKAEMLSKLGISAKQIQMARQNAQMMERIESGDLSNLPSSKKYKGDKGNTELVFQGEAIIVDVEKNPRLEGVYTFGATTCLILALTLKDNKGVVKQIGLAHIDTVVSPAALENYISSIQDPKATLSAAIIGGERNTALEVAKVLDKKKVPIIFANANVGGALFRSDAVALGRDGKLYYGNLSELDTSVDRNKLKAIELERRTSAFLESPTGGLNIKRK